MNVLGISCYFHDSAAALVSDGKLIAAIEEERLSRIKHDASFPNLALEGVLREAGMTVEDLDYVVYYEKPVLKYDRILRTHIAEWPRSLGSYLEMQDHWLKTKLRVKSKIRARLKDPGNKAKILFSEHHESHAAAAFFCSPYDRAAIVTIDGVGEWATAKIFLGSGNTINPIKEIRFPHSIGLFYSAFTDYLGFEVNEGEYKVMGLAPYGRPVYVDPLRKLLALRPDGSFSLGLRYFAFQYSDRMLDFRLVERELGFPRRKPRDPIAQEHRDLASSVQTLTEEAVLGLAEEAIRVTGEKKVCLAGGVALNCVANSRVLRESGAEGVFVFPASGDSGGAVGAALLGHYRMTDALREGTPFGSAYLGPQFAQDEIIAYLGRLGIPFEQVPPEALPGRVAKLIEDQKIVGWFQGRMEFGPRALGNRSILADPRRKENWARVNRKVKFREDFRPLAPAVMEEFARDFFDLDEPSPYMLFTAMEKTGSLPAVTHVDGSSRVQTVSREQNPLFHSLLAEFQKRTGVPALINTSFNTSGMPIVCSPQNAFQCFAESRLDALILGNCVIERERIPYLQKEEENELHE